MTVQELIDKLMLVEDKSIEVIREYDAWYHLTDPPVIVELYADKDNKNIDAYDTDNIRKKFLLINPT